MVTTFTSFQNYVSSFMSLMWDSSWSSFDETFSRRHQLIIWEIVLETIFSTLRSVCLNDMFSRSRHRFTSLTFDRWNQLGVRHIDIYSHSVDYTTVPLESLTLMVISLALVNGSHHWPSNKVVSTMFDFRSL